MVHLIPDKKQAKQDADTLINGDLHTAVHDKEFAEPQIEERQSHPGDPEDTQVTLELHVGGEHIADIFPMSDDFHHDYAYAIRRAGIHIHALLQENARLEASVGRDIFEDKQQLIVILRRTHDVLKQASFQLAHTLEVDEKASGMYALVKDIETVLTATDKKPKEG